MLDESEYYDILHAYAIGCLDKDDLLKLEEYLSIGGELPWQELGEYQNLTALLPSILNIETPGPQLKDNVARQLYRIRNEKRAKRTTEKASAAQPPVNKIKNDQQEKQENLSNIFKRTRTLIEEQNEEHEAAAPAAEVPKPEEPQQKKLKIEEFEVISSKENVHEPMHSPPENQTPSKEPQGFVIKEFDRLDGENSFQETVDSKTEDIKKEKIISKPISHPYTENNFYETHGAKETAVVKSNTGGIILTIILFLIIAAAIGYFYVKISTDVSTYKTGIEKLNQQIKQLSTQIADNKEIQKVLQTKNVGIVNLAGTEINKSGYGKLIISFENSKGYMQLSSMPVLSNDDTYQLWVIVSGKFVSLGLFRSKDNVDYFPFTIPQLTNKGETKFLVSEEPSTGSETPSKRIYLTGSLQ